MVFGLPQRRDVISFLGVFGLLAGVYLLPPDTALQQVRAAGALRACMPPDYPPLVTGVASAPGIDVELLRGIARELGVSLVTVENPMMGKDFNPRAWHLTRAQCDVLAGGVVGSPTTRSFLETTPAYATTGWAWLSPRDDPTLQSRRVGVLVGVSGLDRIALAAYLRSMKAQVTINASADELVQGLQAGRFDIGITERLLADTLAGRLHWKAGWMPPQFACYPVVLGLWKGDLTLKRAIFSAMERMRRSGQIATIVARYVPRASVDQHGVADDVNARTQ